MNSNNNNTPLEGTPEKKGFQGTSKSNKKYNEMSKQVVAKTNNKIQAQFSLS